MDSWTRKHLFWITAALLGSSTLRAWKPPTAPTCARATLSQSARRDYARLERLLAERAYRTRTDQVALTVLSDWEGQGLLAPAVLVNLGPLSRELPDRALEPISGRFLGGSGDARPYVVGGRTRYFRQNDSLLAWVAFQIDQVLQIAQVPKTEIVLLEGRRGVLTEAIAGETLAASARVDHFHFNLREAVRNLQLDPGSLSEAEGFHFLVGDTDGWNGNFKLTPDGLVVGFDFDGAFQHAFSWHYGNPDSIGAALPLLYTARFIEGLSRLTDSEIRRCAPVFPVSARRQISFRRDMMLRDIAIRGQAAILRAWEFPLEGQRE